MKKNAIIIAGILAAAGAAQAQQEASDRYRASSPSQYDQAPSTSTEVLDRDSQQRVVPPTTSDSALNHNWESAGSSSGSVSATVSGDNYEADADEDTNLEGEDSTPSDHDISADSSIRGGSVEARGYDKDANNDEIEGEPNALNPGKQADSSIRGGSIYARERDWNHDSEPSSGLRDHKRHMKADSSIRGGSIEARGGREMLGEQGAQEHRPGRSVNTYSYEADSAGSDYGQGSSATWQSDKG